LITITPSKPWDWSSSHVERMDVKRVNLSYVEGGKVRKLVAYFDSDRAHADLGLEE
jgi:hypothetical protein